MKKIQLGHSLRVHPIGLGAINFGTKISEEQAFQLMDIYVEQGGNFIDTANNYAVWNGGDGGESERTIGMWLTHRNKRSDLVIATKVGALNRGNEKGFTQMEGLSRATILQSVEASLNRLQTSYLDLLYLHVDDFSTPQEEVMGTLAELVNSGKVREIGCSNFYSWRIEKARQLCEKNDWPFFCAVQQRYSYLSPIMDAELFPQVALNADLSSYLNMYPDLKLVAYSPLLKGQYNTPHIENPYYDTLENRKRLQHLLATEERPNSWVLKRIRESFGGSIALVTTSNPKHLIELMREV